MRLKILRKLLVFIIILAWFLSGWPQVWHNPPIPPKIGITHAASQGPNSPSTGSTSADSATVDWTNPGNITVSDDTRATAALFKGKYKKRITTITALLVYCLIVLFKTPFFKEKPKQYQLTAAGVYEKAEIATSSAAVEGQTIIEKTKQVLGKEEVNLVTEDAFEKWAVLENFDAGYKLIYPAGFNIDYEYGKVEIIPPSNSGKVVVYIKNKTFEVKTILENTNNKEEAALLNAASQLIKDSFEFIDSQEYSPEKAKKRFEQ